ncbi:BON domain-containing protein [Mucilaginibacter sp.]|uniref:BON domain-containing protein n=1 Tax=Mucilaginibacter sp. TaxID=1882438 RepID=UPI003D0D806D
MKNNSELNNEFNGVRSLDFAIIGLDACQASKTNDEEIAAKIIELLNKNWIPALKLNIMVKDGWVNIDGELRWNFQNDAVKKIICSIAAVKGVTNNITVTV